MQLNKLPSPKQAMKQHRTTVVIPARPHMMSNLVAFEIQPSFRSQTLLNSYLYRFSFYDKIQRQGGCSVDASIYSICIITDHNSEKIRID